MSRVAVSFHVDITIMDSGKNKNEKYKNGNCHKNFYD